MLNCIFFLGKCRESLERARNLLKITSQARKYKSVKICLNSHDVSQKESQDHVEDSSEINSLKVQKKFTKRYVCYIPFSQLPMTVTKCNRLYINNLTLLSNA